MQRSYDGLYTVNNLSDQVIYRQHEEKWVSLKCRSMRKHAHGILLVPAKVSDLLKSSCIDFYTCVFFSFFLFPKKHTIDIDFINVISINTEINLPMTF